MFHMATGEKVNHSPPQIFPTFCCQEGEPKHLPPIPTRALQALPSACCCLALQAALATPGCGSAGWELACQKPGWAVGTAESFALGKVTPQGGHISRRVSLGDLLRACREQDSVCHICRPEVSS